MVAEVRSGWTEDFAKPKWGMVPIDYAHLKYELGMDGRVVQVTRDDGSYALREANRPHDSYDTLLCQDKGHWVLIR